MRTLTLFLCFLTSIIQAQDFTITPYDLGNDLNDSQLMQFAETADGQVYFLYFYFESGVRDHRMQVFDGSAWTPISRPCERCINQLLGSSDGQLYAAADEEILWYNPDNDSWSTYLAEPALRLLQHSEGTMTFINADGAFDYDGTTVTPRNNANFPNVAFISTSLYAPDGDLYTIMNTQVFRQDDNGWTALSDVTSPLRLALAPDGKVYVADNFGGVHYYEDQFYTANAITGVFPSFFGLKGFAIGQNGVFWGATQGMSPSLVRYEPPSSTAAIPATDLIPESILLTEVFVASNNLVFVVSDFRTYVTTIADGMATSVLELETATLDFSVSPNPNEGEMQIKWNQLPRGAGTLEIFNTMGQSCHQAPLTVTEGSGQLDIITSDLASGNYWLVLRIGKYFGRQQLTIN